MAKKTISKGRVSREESVAVVEETMTVPESELPEDSENAAKGESKAEKESAAGVIGGAMKRGIILENPVLRLVLGTCPTLTWISLARLSLASVTSSSKSPNVIAKSYSFSFLYSFLLIFYL